VVKLLLDENLSPRVALDLRADGNDVVHLREPGRLGIADPDVLALAFAEDRILVTANVADFRRLAAGRELHAGIVLLLDGRLRRDEQLELLRRVIAGLDGGADLINRVLTVALDGGFTIEELAPRGERRGCVGGSPSRGQHAASG
jgi:predicted nuclease of predicted toxin-antitoxin system